MEYLSHVIFAGLPLEVPERSLEAACSNFLPRCRVSPCDEKHFKPKS